MSDHAVLIEEKAVEMAAVEYATDPELTAFCALDGEDFYETRKAVGTRSPILDRSGQAAYI